MLQAQHGVKEQPAGEVEDQKRERIARPVLVLHCSLAGSRIDALLHRHEHRGKQRALALEDPRHVAAERPGERDQDGCIKQELKNIASHFALLRIAPAAAMRP